MNRNIYCKKIIEKMNINDINKLLELLNLKHKVTKLIEVTPEKGFGVYAGKLCKTIEGNYINFLFRLSKLSYSEVAFFSKTNDLILNAIGKENDDFTVDTIVFIDDAISPYIEGCINTKGCGSVSQYSINNLKENPGFEEIGRKMDEFFENMDQREFFASLLAYANAGLVNEILEYFNKNLRVNNVIEIVFKDFDFEYSGIIVLSSRNNVVFLKVISEDLGVGIVDEVDEITQKISKQIEKIDELKEINKGVEVESVLLNVSELE